MLLNWIQDNFQIIGVILLVLLVLIVRLVGIAREGSRRKAEGKRVRRWKQVLDRCAGTGDWHLRKSEVAWFSDDDMLRAFDFLKENGEMDACVRILADNSAAIADRTGTRADAMELGFFAYMLSTADLSKLPQDARTIYVNEEQALLSAGSVYNRENALKALYNLGDAKAVAAAIETLSADARLHNEKLLADGMNTFRGDRHELAVALMESFEKYDDHSQSAVIAFFTVAGFHEYDGYFKARLQDSGLSMDQRCDILRLLMKVPSEETKRCLLDELRANGHGDAWQAAAVSATGLSAYPGDEEVLQALLANITSPHWDVRINCAFALVKLDPPQAVLDSIAGGEDSYAADALRFALTSQKTEARS